VPVSSPFYLFSCGGSHISSSIRPKSFIQMVKYSFFSQRILVYQCFFGPLFVFSYFFFQEKVLCFSPRRQAAYEMFISVKRSEDPCRKNDISSSIRPKSFIQTVKYSFFSQRIVYQSCFGASFVFSFFFFFKKKFCVSAHSASCLRNVY